MSSQRHGPGPIVHGPSLTDPTRYIVEQPGEAGPTLMTREEIAAIPIQHQWFSGTQTGLIASWWTRDIAEQHGQQLGVIVGQILPFKVSRLTEHDLRNGRILVVLADINGRPLEGA